MGSLSGGQGTINIFINETAVHSNELAYNSVTDNQLRDLIGMGEKYKFDKMTKSRKRGFCGSFFSEMDSAPLKTPELYS